VAYHAKVRWTWLLTLLDIQIYYFLCMLFLRAGMQFGCRNFRTHLTRDSTISERNYLAWRNIANLHSFSAFSDVLFSTFVFADIENPLSIPRYYPSLKWQWFIFCFCFENWVEIRSEEFLHFRRRYHDNMICAMCSAEQLFNHGSVLDQRKTVGFLTLVLREAEKKKADIFRR